MGAGAGAVAPYFFSDREEWWWAGGVSWLCAWKRMSCYKVVYTQHARYTMDEKHDTPAVTGASISSSSSGDCAVEPVYPPEWYVNAYRICNNRCADAYYTEHPLERSVPPQDWLLYTQIAFAAARGPIISKGPHRDRGVAVVARIRQSLLASLDSAASSPMLQEYTRFLDCVRGAHTLAWGVPLDDTAQSADWELATGKELKRHLLVLLCSDEEQQAVANMHDAVTGTRKMLEIAKERGWVHQDMGVLGNGTALKLKPGQNELPARVPIDRSTECTQVIPDRLALCIKAFHGVARATSQLQEEIASFLDSMRIACASDDAVTTKFLQLIASKSFPTQGMVNVWKQLNVNKELLVAMQVEAECGKLFGEFILQQHKDTPDLHPRIKKEARAALAELERNGSLRME
jgi:hypothetical protein